MKLAKVGDKAGRFRINDHVHLLAKHASSDRSPWCFTFQPEDIRTLMANHNRAGLFGSYLCLICGLDSICVLRSDEWLQLLDIGASGSSQTIRVRRPARCSMEVSGSEGRLKKKIHANRFPSLLLDDIKN